MRFKYFLNEKRRNPEINKKVASVEILKQWAGRENVFVSFTEINKLGLNPKSRFDTPLGIYAYPIDKAIEYNKNNQMFATNQPYLQVFEVPTSQITRISKYKESDLKRDLEKLCVIWKKRVPSQTDEAFYSLYEETIKKSKNQNPFTKLWYFIMKLSKISSTKREPYEERFVSAKPTVVQWNSILRELGYFCINDDEGSGTIHPNEEFQSVCLSTKHIKILQTIDNKNPQKEARIIKTYDDLLNFVDFLVNEEAIMFYAVFEKIIDAVTETPGKMINLFDIPVRIEIKTMDWSFYEPLFHIFGKYFSSIRESHITNLLMKWELIRKNPDFFIGMFNYFVKTKNFDWCEEFFPHWLAHETLRFIEVPKLEEWYFDWYCKNFKIFPSVIDPVEIDGEEYKISPDSLKSAIMYLLIENKKNYPEIILSNGKRLMIKSSKAEIFWSIRFPYFEQFTKFSKHWEETWLVDFSKQPQK